MEPQSRGETVTTPTCPCCGSADTFHGHNLDDHTCYNCECMWTESRRAQPSAPTNEAAEREALHILLREVIHEDAGEHFMGTDWHEKARAKLGSS